MKKEKRGRHIVMAIDLKAAESRRLQQSWKALQPLLRDNDTIQPVAVLDRADAAVGNIIRSSIGKIRLAAERHLGDEMKRFKDDRIVEPTVLFADGSSHQRAVAALLRYAKKSNTDLIAVGTHSRTGAKRFFLGSFAETIALQANTPIVVLNPHTKPKAVRAVLYATDFSDRSREGLEELCRFLGDTKCRILLFHCFVPQTSLYVEPFFAGTLPSGTLEKLTEEEFQNLQRTGKAWCEKIRQKGFPVELQFGRRSMFVDEQILSAAKRGRVGMIALVSNSGKITSAVLGSTTRQLLRESTWPVWVLHPPKEKARTKEESHELRAAV